MNSQEYIEMATGLKEIYEKNDKEKKIHISKFNNLYKNVCIIYGLIRTFQENEDNLEYQHLIEEIRHVCSLSLFSHLIDNDD